MHPSRTRRGLLLGLGASSVALSGCLDGVPSANVPGDDAGDDASFDVLVRNLEIPWDVTAVSTGELFLTERTGRVLRLDGDELSALAEPDDAIDAEALDPGAEDAPWWVEGGEGGTLGVAADPRYPEPAFVYVYYTSEEGVNRVVRFDVDAEDVEGSREVIVDGIPAETTHNGGRIAFGPDDRLWICTGDAERLDETRDPASLAGKVLRVTAEGGPAEGNPDLGSGADPRVYTLGHRNPQGIDWLPDGTPVIAEHGPGARDEVNVLIPGGDYGWPDARGPPGDEQEGPYDEFEGVVPPLVNTGPRTTWAPSGLCYYGESAIPEWEGKLLVAGLRSQRLNVVAVAESDDPPEIEGEDATRYDEEWYYEGYTAASYSALAGALGRIRHVEAGPEGELYAITSNRDGRTDEDDPFPTDRDDVLVRLTGE
ncbi:PQQ-dependent sugar dehydrogenase [Natronorarus salvus]|uniref:PQQ-dependent sugar dehydrogenase n=1 Tax=Natronorarus salvus TaxID=3117733 RepID=UPI002F26B19D